MVNDLILSIDNVYYGMMEELFQAGKLWNSEHPYLYTLVIKLTDKRAMVDAKSNKVEVQGY